MGEILSKPNCCCEKSKTHYFKTDRKKKEARKTTLMCADKLIHPNLDETSASPMTPRDKHTSLINSCNISINDEDSVRTVDVQEIATIVHDAKGNMIQKNSRSFHGSRPSYQSILNSKLASFKYDKRHIYEKIIEDTKIDSLFDEVLERKLLSGKLEGCTKICCKKYDTENGYGYKVECREKTINKYKHHEYKQVFSFDPKSFTPKEFL